ncbi:hypothetical protein D3C87_90100 [compost metagenome]
MKKILLGGFIIFILQGALANTQSSIVKLTGQVTALNADSIELKDAQGKILIIPKKFLRKKYKASDLVQLEMTNDDFNEVKLKYRP